MKNYNFYYILLFLLLSLIACEENPNQGYGPYYNGAKEIATVNDLPSCSFINEGQIYYVTELDEFKYCNGTEYSSIDLSGLRSPLVPAMHPKVAPDSHHGDEYSAKM